MPGCFDYQKDSHFFSAFFLFIFRSNDDGGFVCVFQCKAPFPFPPFPLPLEKCWPSSLLALHTGRL